MFFSNSFFDVDIRKKTKHQFICIQNGNEQETLNWIYVNSCEILLFVSCMCYMSQEEQKTLKKTLESAQYGSSGNHL